HLRDPTPPVSKDVPEIPLHSLAAPLAPAVDVRVDLGKANRRAALADHFRPPPAPPSASTTGTASGETAGTPSSAGGGGPPEGSPLGWGRRDGQRGNRRHSVVRRRGRPAGGVAFGLGALVYAAGAGGGHRRARRGECDRGGRLRYRVPRQVGR
ncbi:hypothetical protein B296_00056824, partial [Ensete ventricosum]